MSMSKWWTTEIKSPDQVDLAKLIHSLPVIGKFKRFQSFGLTFFWGNYETSSGMVELAFELGRDNRDILSTETETIG